MYKEYTVLELEHALSDGPRGIKGPSKYNVSKSHKCPIATTITAIITTTLAPYSCHLPCGLPYLLALLAWLHCAGDIESCCLSLTPSPTMSSYDSVLELVSLQCNMGLRACPRPLRSCRLSHGLRSHNHIGQDCDCLPCLLALLACRKNNHNCHEGEGQKDQYQ